MLYNIHATNFTCFCRISRYGNTPTILNFFIIGSLIVLKHASTFGKLLAAVLADRNLICSGSLNPNGGQALHPVMKKKNFLKKWTRQFCTVLATSDEFDCTVLYYTSQYYSIGRKFYVYIQ